MAICLLVEKQKQTDSSQYFFQISFTKMDGTLPAPDGKKRVITEKITTERTIVEDLEVTGASQLGMYIYNDYHIRI